VVSNAIETSEPDAGAVKEFRGSLGAAPGEVTIGFSGRVEAPKGIPVLLAALRQLPAGVPPWRLHAFGEGSLGGLLHEASSRDSRIQVHPFLPGLGRLVAAFDVVVLPSLYEGLPLTLLEAMNGRCAIVASSVGGIPDAVRENTEALLVPPADPAALSGAIALLLNNPAERRRLGEAARQRVVEHFSVDGLIRATETVYRTLLHD
jgi:glycosyltransferase involved in cell wall biosynthesis